MSYVVIAPKIQNQLVSSLTRAKDFIENNPNINPLLATNLIGNSGFINERVQEALAVGVRDFTKVNLFIDGVADIVQYLQEITAAVEKWAGKSFVKGAHGERVAIVSQPNYSEVHDQDEIFYEVWLSSAVLFNHRRATLNHPKDKQEFEQDLNSLVKSIRKINPSITVEAEPILGRGVLGNFKAVPKQIPTSIPAVLLAAPSHAINVGSYKTIVQQAVDHLTSVTVPLRLKVISQSIGVKTGSASYKALSKYLLLLARENKLQHPARGVFAI